MTPSSVGEKRSLGSSKSSLSHKSASRLRPPSKTSQSSRNSSSTKKANSSPSYRPVGRVTPVIKETKASRARAARGKAMREYQAMSPSMQRKHSMLVEKSTPPLMSLSGGKSKARFSSSGRAMSDESKPRRRSLRQQQKRESRERTSLGVEAKHVQDDTLEDEIQIPPPISAMSRSELRIWAKSHPQFGINGNSTSSAIRVAMVKYSKLISKEPRSLRKGAESSPASPKRFGWNGNTRHSSSDLKSSTTKKYPQRQAKVASKIPVGRWR